MFVAVIAPLILLALIIYAMWKGKPGFQKEFRDREQGLADLLRYNKIIKNGVMLGKGGELMAGFFFRGVDLDSSTNEEIMAVMGRLNAGLMKFSDGWMLHIDSIRSTAIGYAPEGAFPHPVLRLMDHERRQQFLQEGAHYEGLYACVLTWLPPLKIEAKAAAMMYEHSEDRTEMETDLPLKTLEMFERQVNEFGGALNAMFKGVARLGQVGGEIVNANRSKAVVDDLAGFLRMCATGVGAPVMTSRNSSMDMDAEIGNQDFVGGNTPKVGNKHIRCLSIEGFPTESSPLVLEILNRLPVTYRWSTRFIFFDPQTAKSVIGRIRKKWKQKLRPITDQVFNKTGGPIDRDALDMAADAEGAIGEVSTGIVKHGHYTSVVVLMDENLAAVEEAARIAKTAIEDIGFGCRLETVNSVEAFLGTLPGHGYENVRKPIMHTMNLAYLFPATATWSGVQTHPCNFYPPNSPPLFYADATGGTPFRFVHHYGDVGHFLMVGPTGSGKSTAVQTILSQHFRYPRARGFLFEKGYSGYVLSKAVRGTHYDIGGEEEGADGRYAPLANIDRPSERLWASDWLTMCLELQKVDVTPKIRNTINDALVRLANEPKEHRTMTMLVNQIQDDSIREGLKFYTLDGNNPYLDGKPSEEALDLGQFNVFEMENLMEMGEQHVVPILLYLFRRIELSLHGEPTLIILDEAWLMLTHPLFRERIKKWLKTLRKAVASVGFATQEVADLANSPIRDVIFASCPVKILLPNPSAKSENQIALYRELGLNDQQIDLVAYGEQKRDYYYISPYGSRLFKLSLGPMMLAFTGASGKDEVKLARELQKEHGEGWVVEWTRRRAGPGWARALAEAL